MNTTHAKLAKRLPTWLYKIGAQLYIDRVYPRHIFIETTATCNLSCSYCPREQISQDMDFGLFREILDEASRYGPRSFSLHLFGEPFLYARLFEACSYVKHRNPRHTILLTTNGTKINQQIDDLVSSGVDQVLWTWRREARFREATLLKLRKWGKFRVRFIDEITPQKARDEWRDWPNVEQRRIHNYGGDIDIQAITGRPTASIKTRWPCYHLWLAPAVSWNGDILICCADPHKKEVIGHFPDVSLAEVWQGDRLNVIRESHLSGEYNGICSKCDVWREYPDIFFQFQRRKMSGNRTPSTLQPSILPQVL